VYSYNYNKNLSDVYSRIEELNKKLKDDTINQMEKKELGTLIVEKVSNYEEGYNILKDFLSENYPPALYAKAKILELEDKEEEAIQIYNEIFMKNKYYLAGFELASKLVKTSKNYELAMKVLEDTNSDEPVISGYKGFVYENMKQYKKAEENYLKAVEKNDIGIMIYLGSLYENLGETKKAKDIYTKAYHLGSVDAGYKLSYLLEELEENKIKDSKNNKKDNAKKDSKDDVKKSKEAKKILENLVKNGDDYSMVDLSLYYPQGDPNIRILNLKAAAKLNKTAFYNLGVFYYEKKNKEKAKFYLKVAKENGYDIGTVFERYIRN
jgi:SLEI family protein